MHESITNPVIHIVLYFSLFIFIISACAHTTCKNYLERIQIWLVAMPRWHILVCVLFQYLILRISTTLTFSYVIYESVTRKIWFRNSDRTRNPTDPKFYTAIWDDRKSEYNLGLHWSSDFGWATLQYREYPFFVWTSSKIAFIFLKESYNFFKKCPFKKETL